MENSSVLAAVCVYVGNLLVCYQQCVRRWLITASFTFALVLSVTFVVTFAGSHPGAFCGAV
jgi:hypothetical protein